MKERVTLYHHPQPYSWASVQKHLHQSLYAQKMVCSMSTQLFYIPRTKDLKGNREMHEHLVPASYHRVTALGTAHRLMNGEHHESLLQTLEYCIGNAMKEDQQVMQGLRVMKEAASDEVKPFIEMIINWQKRAEAYLQRAQKKLHNMGVQDAAGSYVHQGY